jgi:hypothetical protein
MRIKTLFLFSILCVWFKPNLLAQKEKEVKYTIGVQPIYAWLFIHSKSIEKYRGCRGYGLQVDFNRYRQDSLAYSYGKRHYNSGFSVQAISFTKDLGNALNFAYFMEPFLIERGGFSFRLRAAGGLNLASNPNRTNNPDNRAYSSHVNGYLGLGFSTHFKLSQNSQLFLNATYGHFSNGNTKNPNAGVNYPHVGLGYEYKFAEKKLPLQKLLFYKEHWRFDVGGFLCNKSLPLTPNSRYWTYGMFAQVGYRTNTINAWTLATEAYVDESMRFALDNHPVYGRQHLDNRLLGLLFGHEFLFSRCIFSQQIGVYLYKEIPGEFVNRIYHRFGFNYKLSKRVMLGINLNSNLQKAFILDGRLIYNWYHP